MPGQQGRYFQAKKTSDLVLIQSFYTYSFMVYELQSEPETYARVNNLEKQASQSFDSCS